jgi:16S rRNA U516 pseudouridylate synthase RsuA-like enzyme
MRFSALAKGLYITREGYTAQPAKAKILDCDDDTCLLSITIREGKKREIRHMMETVRPSGPVLDPCPDR